VGFVSWLKFFIKHDIHMNTPSPGMPETDTTGPIAGRFLEPADGFGNCAGLDVFIDLVGRIRKRREMERWPSEIFRP
jgi:hypothetical protein